MVSPFLLDGYNVFTLFFNSFDTEKKEREKITKKHHLSDGKRVNRCKRYIHNLKNVNGFGFFQGYIIVYGEYL